MPPISRDDTTYLLIQMLPPDAQKLLSLLLGSQAKHEVLHTQKNRQHLEHWARNVLRFYRSTSRRLTRRSDVSRGRRLTALRGAARALEQQRTEISQMIEMIVSFESILMPPSPKRSGTHALVGARNSAAAPALNTKSVTRLYLDMLERVYTDVAGTVRKTRAPRRPSRSPSPSWSRSRSRSPGSRRTRSRSWTVGGGRNKDDDTDTK